MKLPDSISPFVSAKELIEHFDTPAKPHRGRWVLLDNRLHTGEPLRPIIREEGIIVALVPADTDPKGIADGRLAASGPALMEALEYLRKRFAWAMKPWELRAIDKLLAEIHGRSI